MSVGVLALVLWPAAAEAHALLESSNPAAGSVLTTAPSMVVLHFSEAVQLPLDALQVINDAGDPMQAAAPTNGPQGSDVEVPLKPGLADGTYLVSYRVISADSHPVSGSFSFSIGHASAVPVARINGSDLGFALGAARFAGYLGLILFIGVTVFSLLIRRDDLGVRWRVRLVGFGWVWAVAGTLGELLLQGAYDAGLGIGSSLDMLVLDPVLHTRLGHALLARLALLVFAAGPARALIRQRHRAAEWLFIASAVALVLTFAVTGHSAIGSDAWLALPSDVLHLSAIAVWLGGLAALTAVLAAARTADDPKPIVERFSSVALTAVAIILVTGTYQAWREVRILDALPHTAYGRLLLWKVGFVLAALVAAVFSRRWVFRVRLGSTAGLRQLRTTVALETAAALTALGIASALVAAPPANTDYRPVTSATLTAGPESIQVSIVPRGSRLLDIHLYTFGPSGTINDVKQLTASLTLSARGIGPVAIPLIKAGNGHYLANGFQLPYTGTWTLTIGARTDAFSNYITTTEVTVR